MTLRKLVLMAALVLALGAAPAQAAPIAGVSGPNNNIIGNDLPGWYNANLYLIGGPATLTFEYIGKEAGWLNEFWFGAGDDPLAKLFDTNDNPATVANVVVAAVPGGLLNFQFRTNQGSGSADTIVANADNVDRTVGPNFFISFQTPGKGPYGSPFSGGQFAYLAFDDFGPANLLDDNHDDMVVKVSITGGRITPFESVPDGGSTLGFLGLALIGLAALRRRTVVS